MSDTADRVARWHRAVAGVAGCVSLALETRRLRPALVDAWITDLRIVTEDMKEWSDANTQAPARTGSAVPPVRQPEPRAANKPRTKARRRRA